MNMTEEELRKLGGGKYAHLLDQKRPNQRVVAPVAIPAPIDEPKPKTGDRAAWFLNGIGHVERRAKDDPNQTEAEYMARLALRRDLVRIEFQAFFFRLGYHCFYCPDILAVTTYDEYEIHEIKGGHTWEDSKIKYKTAAELYPMFKWFLAEKAPKKQGGAWKVEQYRRFIGKGPK